METHTQEFSATNKVEYFSRQLSTPSNVTSTVSSPTTFDSESAKYDEKNKADEDQESTKRLKYRSDFRSPVPSSSH